MPGLVPGIHVLLSFRGDKDVDGRVKPGHDELETTSLIQPQLRLLAARRARGLRLPSIEQRAQGKPGARCTRSLACELKKHASKVTTGSPGSRPAFPAQRF
jgi:hypothetical protein